MAAPRDNHWLDIGDGVRVYDGASDLDDHTRGKNSMSCMTRRTTRIRSPSLPSPQRASIGLHTPPSSDRKKAYATSPQSSKVSHLGYAYKLKVPDTKGRKLPRILFRWSANPLLVLVTC